MPVRRLFRLLAEIVLICLSLVLTTGRANALTLRAPTQVTVTLKDDKVASVSDRAGAFPAFVKVELLADFACPTGTRVRELRAQTDWDSVSATVTGSTASTLANRTLPMLNVVALNEMRQSCRENKTTVDVNVRLSAVCTDPKQTSFEKALTTVTATQKIAVKLVCSNVTKPRFRPATIVPHSFKHECTLGGGIEGKGDSTRVLPHARPLACGSSYNQQSPAFTQVTVFEGKHTCPSGYYLYGFARTSLVFDQNLTGGTRTSAYGMTRYCALSATPPPGLSTPTMMKVGQMSADLRGATPTFAVVTEPEVRFKPAWPEVPPGMALCKRADFRVLDEADLLNVTSGGAGVCKNDVQTVKVQMRESAKSAARIACTTEAAKLKKEGKWEGLPSAGTARQFSVQTGYKSGLVGRYCFGTASPVVDLPFFDQPDFTYTVECDKPRYQNEWSGQIPVTFQVKCLAN